MDPRDHNTNEPSHIHVQRPSRVTAQRGPADDGLDLCAMVLLVRNEADRAEWEA